MILGNATIDGIFSLDGAGSVAGGGSLGTGSGGGGGGHGGYGGGNSTFFGGAYDLVANPTQVGGGGGFTTAGQVGGPGSGGGALNLTINGNLTVNGTLSANGRDGDPNFGGGAGGSFFITCSSLLGSGTICANGGNGGIPSGSGAGGSGGGGGRIAIRYDSNAFTGTLLARGGNGLVPGGAGTVYTRLKNTPVGDSLVIDNGGLIGTNTPLSSTFLSVLSSFSLTIRGGAAVMPISSLPLLSNLTVSANGKITSASGQNIVIAVSKNVSILSGAAISVNGKGFGQAGGPGAGHASINTGSGGGYGGPGGASGLGALGGATNGSATQPVDLGSGGGAGANTYFGGSEGGGAIRLTVGGTLNLDGSVSANGNPGLQDNSGGGAGGSVWITAGALTGAGTISADGGSGELFSGGGGGGGRIAIYCPSNLFSGTLSAVGGSGFANGGAGSVIWSNLPAIRGTVTDTNGQPVAGVLVSASAFGVSTTTGPDGKYTLGVVPYVSFSVQPSLTGFLFAPASRSYPALTGSVSNADFLMLTDFTPTMGAGLQGTNLLVSWFAYPGITYQLYSSTNLLDWLPYGSPAAGSNVVLELTIPVGDDPHTFFRVQAGN